jgi:hypothetical protein
MNKSINRLNIHLWWVSPMEFDLVRQWDESYIDKEAGQGSKENYNTTDQGTFDTW